MFFNINDSKEYKTFKINMSRSDFLITLSKGINPITGEVLFAPSKDLSNAILSLAGFILRKDKKDAKTFSVRDDSEKVVDTLKSERTQFLENEDKSKWSIEEDNELLKEFRNSFPLETIAFRHNRTISSIKRRLLQLSSVSKSEDAN